MTLRAKILSIFVLLITIGSTDLLAQRYSQIVVPFPNERRYDYHFNQQNNSVLINILETSPEELEPVYNYDERLVKRLVIREHSDRNTQISLVLKDNDVQAAIYSFTEPDRLVIDLYDQSFRESNDPSSGLPFVDNQHPGQINNDEPTKAPSNSTPTMLLQAKNGGMDEARNKQNKKPANKYKRRLLQARPEGIGNSKDLLMALEKTNPGTGAAWKNYPIYLYRFPTSSLKSGKNYKSWLKKNANRALSSSESMADYAAQLYDFGHELKSLIAYQKVLHEAPLVFDKEPKHIWNLAEIHLGQHNLVLARGYYESLITKHPDSPLAQYAKLRIVDIESVNAIEKNKLDKLKDLSQKMAAISTNQLPELSAQIAIRKTFWMQNETDTSNSLASIDKKIPNPNLNNVTELGNSLPKAENPKTSFLISTILLNHKLKDKNWSKDTQEFASRYFTKYMGRGSEPYRTRLLDIARNNIASKILKSAEENKSLEAINTYTSIPKSLKASFNTRKLSWSLAESYRKIQRPQQAAMFYEKSFNMSTNKVQEFQAKINQLNTLKDRIDIVKAKGNSTLARKINNQFNAEDKKLLQVWKELSDSEKIQMSVQYKDYIKNNLNQTTVSKTENKILLWTWRKSISSDPETKAGLPKNWTNSFVPAEDTVLLLSRLSKKFLKEGDTKNYKESKSLLRNIDPSDFKNPESEKIWAKELTELAEIHRENNEYLDAGRLYALTGTKTKNWDKRAEALYKGGLLLYRSGRREEALKAFEQAAGDGNNLLYAELAQKRLEQLKE